MEGGEGGEIILPNVGDKGFGEKEAKKLQVGRRHYQGVSVAPRGRLEPSKYPGKAP